MINTIDSKKNTILSSNVYADQILEGLKYTRWWSSRIDSCWEKVASEHTTPASASDMRENKNNGNALKQYNVTTYQKEWILILTNSSIINI